MILVANISSSTLPKMSIKKSLFLTILYFATIHSQSLPSKPNDQKTLQNENVRNTDAQNDVLWTSTPPEQNTQFLPLSDEASLNIFQIKYYYESDLRNYYPKDQFLKTVYDFANTIDTLQKSSNVNLNVSNVLFYNEKTTTQQFLDDVKTYYHSDVYKTSFESTNNVTVLASINEWISQHTNGRGYKLDHLIMSNKSYLQISLLSFTGCWDKPKTSANLIKGLKFKTPTEEITVDAFHAKEKVGYYNNSELKYEAIRLPYKNNEFAIAIVLPHQDLQPSEFINNLHDPKKYHELVSNINEHEENIEYTIPTINLSYISLNENGTSVNGENPIVCESSAPNQAQQPISNEAFYKPFYVNRPFAVSIYDVKTKLNLVYTSVKNPTSDHSSWKTLANKNRFTERVFFLQSSNLYEFFQIYLN